MVEVTVVVEVKVEVEVTPRVVVEVKIVSIYVGPLVMLTNVLHASIKSTVLDGINV